MKKKSVKNKIGKLRNEGEIQHFISKRVVSMFKQKNPLFQIPSNEIRFQNSNEISGREINGACILLDLDHSKEQNSYSKPMTSVIFTSHFTKESLTFQLYGGFHEIGHYSKTSYCIFDNKLYSKVGPCVTEYVNTFNPETNYWEPEIEREIGRGLCEGMQHQEALEFTKRVDKENYTSSLWTLGNSSYYPLLLQYENYLSKPARALLKMIEKEPISQCLGLYLDAMSEAPKNEFSKILKELLQTFDNIHDRAMELSRSNKSITLLKIEESESEAIKIFSDFCKNNSIEENLFGRIDGITIFEEMNNDMSKAI